jgi:hypothetical protein
MSLTELLGVDDGLTTLYNVDLDASPNHVQHDDDNDIGRTAIKFETGSDGIGQKIQSVWVRGRKYGNPTGDITVNIRKISDDLTVLIGTFDIRHFVPGAEQSFAVRNRQNSYQMLAGDFVSVEYPSDATNGFEISTNSVASDPTNYTSRSHNGTVWSVSALTDPLAITIKGI